MVQEEIRRRNLGALLRHVHLDGSLSRAALAERMGLNRSTIMALTAELTAAGSVREEVPTDTGRAGRPSLVVRPESTRVYVLAFDVAVDWLVAARVGLGGVVLDRRWAARPRAGADLDRVVEVLAGFGRQLHDAAPPGSVCAGVGASYCGMIRPGDGMVRFGPDMGWVDQAFGAELGHRLGLGLPVPVGNEAHLGAVAEHQRGAGVGFQNLIYLHGDVGVGGGIIVGGKLLDGEGGYGCELGHMVVNPYAGRPCGCGSHGCLEAEVGERALLDAAGRPADLIGRDALRAVVGDADRGDVSAQDALHRIGDWLGIGVANLINLFNPGVVIFGGMLRDVYPGAAEPVRARIARHVLPVAKERVRLRTSALGDDATLVGAAELGFSRLLADPLGVLAGAETRDGRRRRAGGRRVTRPVAGRPGPPA
ncbi:ROK family transcriptional regulator [Micromonospora narathiwatensis]|uniref:Sugar kinase of the NBD/HSP70 family, may contain an N-terminal HTH domain n=1 Tax=Micromonospora narathiwatensis TaxID=299146 RepID=A0A1A8ZRE4_9ACTN|nr:ROK family transcriptional regulator [Micromonospora narathiwatensis]SBT46398.1 Sugar kinase of the NBD/HSP70 family, may contain an N-terminal HTH domain [Micromonospora narathiwatensis]